MKTPTALASNIRLMRDFLKLSRDEYGEKIGVTGDVVYTYEQRDTTPKPIVLNRIAEMWKLPVDVLVKRRLQEKNLINLLNSLPIDHSEEKENMMVVEEPSSEYGISVGQLLSQQNKLIQSLNKQSETANTILKRLADNVELKVETIDINLNDALVRIDAVSMEVVSQKVVVLKSLARLEGKAEGSLLKEADNINNVLQKQRKKQGTSSQKSK